MKILLIGASSSLSRSLRPMLATFAEVVTAGRSGCDIALDLAGDITIEPGYDVVINTAAHLGGNDAAALLGAEQVNVIGLLKLCQACTASGAGHLVQVSSIFATLPPSSPFYNAYALSKRQGDEAALLYTKMHPLALTIVRPSQFYGVGDSYRRNQPFLYALMDKAQAGQDIALWGRHDAQRNFIHVLDVADMLARVVRTRTLGVFNCSHPDNVCFSQIARAAMDAFCSAGDLHFLHDKPDTLDNVFAYDDALYRALGHYPQISLARGMQLEAEHRRGQA
jgi:nucleoside-diphosphate-sugar epimerase